MSEAKPETKTEFQGLILIGTVNAQTSRVYKDGVTHFFLSVVSPGSETMHRVEVQAQDWTRYPEGALFKSKVDLRVFNNQVTFQPA